MNNNEGIKNHNVEHRNTITVVLPTIMWNNPSHFFWCGDYCRENTDNGPPLYLNKIWRGTTATVGIFMTEVPPP
jgi:hypothetical protein